MLDDVGRTGGPAVPMALIGQEEAPVDFPIDEVVRGGMADHYPLPIGSRILLEPHVVIEEVTPAIFPYQAEVAQIHATGRESVAHIIISIRSQHPGLDGMRIAELGDDLFRSGCVF